MRKDDQAGRTIAKQDGTQEGLTQLRDGSTDPRGAGVHFTCIVAGVDMDDRLSTRREKEQADDASNAASRRLAVFLMSTRLRKPAHYISVADKSVSS